MFWNKKERVFVCCSRVDIERRNRNCIIKKFKHVLSERVYILLCSNWYRAVRQIQNREEKLNLFSWTFYPHEKKAFHYHWNSIYFTKFIIKFKKGLKTRNNFFKFLKSKKKAKGTVYQFLNYHKTFEYNMICIYTVVKENIFHFLFIFRFWRTYFLNEVRKEKSLSQITNKNFADLKIQTLSQFKTIYTQETWAVLSVSNEMLWMNAANTNSSNETHRILIVREGKEKSGQWWSGGFLCWGHSRPRFLDAWSFPEDLITFITRTLNKLRRNNWLSNAIKERELLLLLD